MLIAAGWLLISGHSWSLPFFRRNSYALKVDDDNTQATDTRNNRRNFISEVSTTAAGLSTVLIGPTWAHASTTDVSVTPAVRHAIKVSEHRFKAEVQYKFNSSLSNLTHSKPLKLLRI